MSAVIRIRPAEPTDVALLFSLILELAEYERAAERVIGSEDLLRDGLFGRQPSAQAVIAELNQAPVGFALFFGTFSTWLCRPGMWLEDLYVSPEHRRTGVGRVLLSHVAQVAVQRGCGRVEWSALHWNASALAFYEALGAAPMGEWQTLRLEGPALERLARGRDDERAA